MKFDRFFSPKRKATPITMAAFMQRFSSDITAINTAIDQDGILLRPDAVHKREMRLYLLIPQLGYLPLNSTQIDNLLRVEHPNLAKIVEVLQVEEDEETPGIKGFQVIVEEKHSHESLETRLNQGAFRKQDDQFRILRGLMHGLEELHRHDIIHANLHPSNILIQDVGHIHVLLTGYGILRDWTMQQLRANMPIKRVRYLSPEQIMPQKFGVGGVIGFNSDLWSMGTIMYEVITQQPLLKSASSSITEHANAVVASELIGQNKWPIHPNAAALDACLIRNAAQRLQTIDQFKQLLDGQHAWKNGQLVRLAPMSPEPPPVAAAPPSTPPPAKTPDRVCPHCQCKNRPDATICANCDMPLGGPASLKAYSTSLVWGIILVGCSFLFWLPVGVADWVRLKLEDVQHWDLIVKIIESFNESSDNDQQEKLVAALAAWALFALICVFLINLFRTIWLTVVNANANAFWPGKSVLSPWVIWGCFVLDVLAVLTLYLAPLVWLITSIYRMQAYQAVWKASNRDFAPATTQHWGIAPMSATLLLWGLAGLMTPFLLALHFLPSDLEFKISTTWLVVAGILSASQWILGIVVILRMAYRQRMKFERMAKQAA